MPHLLAGRSFLFNHGYAYSSHYEEQALRRPTLKHRGFGLVEILVTVAILAIGLLGLSSLQNRAIQLVQEGDNLVTATMIAQEVAKRMMTNNYVLSLGRQGYLAIDIANATSGGVQDWIDDTITANPNILNCYSADNTESCLNPGDSFAVSADHQDALANMQLMDQVELRQLALNSLPEGEIMICFDSDANALNQWTCDDTATRIAARNENVFTVKVRWRNLYSNQLQVFGAQFTAQCTDGSATYCGN